MNSGVPPLQALSWWVSSVCQDAKDPVGMEQPPRPTMVGADPTETLGDPKVDVAAAETPEWREGIRYHWDFGSNAQPSCCPSQML